MASTEGGHGSGHDLLKQATQAMMSRYAGLYSTAILLQPELFPVFTLPCTPLKNSWNMNTFYQKWSMV